MATNPTIDHTGLTSIQVPVDSTSASGFPEDMYNFLSKTAKPEDVRWETILNRKDIERYLLQYNKQSFRAASESPLGHGVLLDAITFSNN
jgi:hypothetical protein